MHPEDSPHRTRPIPRLPLERVIPQVRSQLGAGLTLLVLATGCAPPRPSPAAPPPPSLPPAPADPVRELVEGFLGFHLYFNPVHATSVGADGYQERLPDVSPAGTAARVDAYGDWVRRVEAVEFRTLDLDREMDLRVILRTARLALAEAEAIRPWTRNPLFHVRLVRDALEPLVGTPGGDDESRLRALSARQRQIPTLLSEARGSLEAPPLLLTQQAMAELEGTITWLRRDLPSRFASAPEAQPKWEFERSNASAVAALEDFLVFLRSELLPRSTAPLALGTETVDRLVDAAGLAPDGTALLQEVDAETARLQRWVEAEAGRMGGGSPGAILARLDGEALPGDSVLPVARRLQEEAREFVVRRGALPLPSGDPPVRPFPLTRIPPPIHLEEAGRVGPAPSPTLRLDPLWAGRPATRGAVEAGVLREGTTGRMVLLETAGWVGRPVRLALPAPGEEEGWGLHSAAFLLDQGFRGGDPLLRLGQLRDRLAIAARLRAGLRLHRGDWTLDQAIRETVATTGLSDAAARRMVERNVHDPLEGASAIQALRYEALRDGLLERPLQAGGPLEMGTAMTVMLATGLSPDLARALLLPPPPG